MRTFRYHKTCLEGRIFDTDNPGEVEDAEADGWVDTPAKLDGTYQETKEPLVVSKSLTQVYELEKEIVALKKEIEALKNPSDEPSKGPDTKDKTLQQKFDDGEDINHDELVALARLLGIKASTHWRPETIAQKIREKS